MPSFSIYGGETHNPYGNTPQGVAGSETDSPQTTDGDGASGEENKNVKEDEPKTETDQPQTTDGDKSSGEEDKDVEEDLYWDEDDVWCIGSAKAFRDFTDNVNNGTISSDAKAKLTADINMEGKEWNTIEWFSGKFDGNNHEITVDADQYLFDVCEGEVEICNLKVINKREDGGKGFIGKVYANADITIKSCSFEGNVKGERYSRTGGFIGEVHAPEGSINITMTNCSFEGEVSGGDSAGGFIGEVLVLGGTANITMTSCSFNGKVTSEGDKNSTGGFIGEVYASGGTIDITPAGGTIDITMTSCSFEGDVSGGDSTGGFIGEVYAPRGTADIKMESCSFNGKVTSEGDSNDIGGFIGRVDANEGTADINIHNCKYNDKFCTRKDKGSLIGLVGQGAEVTIKPDKEVILPGGAPSADNELGVEGEKYSIRHIYYTSKDGQLEIAQEDVLEGKAGDMIYPIEKEGFIYIADKEPDISYDTGLGMKTLTMKYYDEGAKVIADKLEADELKAEKIKMIFIWGLAIVLIAAGGGALLYNIHRKKK